RFVDIEPGIDHRRGEMMPFESLERADARVGRTPRHCVQQTVRASGDANKIKPAVVGRAEDGVCRAQDPAGIIESRRRQAWAIHADRDRERMRLERAPEDAFETVAKRSRALWPDLGDVQRWPFRRVDLR